MVSGPCTLAATGFPYFPVPLLFHPALRRSSVPASRALAVPAPFPFRLYSALRRSGHPACRTRAAPMPVPMAEAHRARAGDYSPSLDTSRKGP